MTLDELQKELFKLTEVTTKLDPLAFELTQSRKETAQKTLSSVTSGTASSILGGLGQGVSPVIRGLISLFTGGEDKKELPTFAKFQLPEVIRAEAALSSSGIDAVNYGIDGLPRRIAPAQPASQSPINIHVQTIDSRSFMDHSESIAQAVREAMLNSHALNDVVSDL